MSQIFTRGCCAPCTIPSEKISYSKVVQLGLPTVKYRKLRSDMVEVYKIINQKYDCAVAPKLVFNHNSVTRGNNYR